MANIIFSEGSGVANSVFGKSQEPIKAMIESGVEAFEEKSLISNIFNMESSTNFAEKYTNETSVGDFETWARMALTPRLVCRKASPRSLSLPPGSPALRLRRR